VVGGCAAVAAWWLVPTQSIHPALGRSQSWSQRCKLRFAAAGSKLCPIALNHIQLCSRSRLEPADMLCRSAGPKPNLPWETARNPLASRRHAGLPSRWSALPRLGLALLLPTIYIFFVILMSFSTTIPVLSQPGIGPLSMLPIQL
jgi:hypothetical protein